MFGWSKGGKKDEPKAKADSASAKTEPSRASTSPPAPAAPAQSARGTPTPAAPRTTSSQAAVPWAGWPDEAACTRAAADLTKALPAALAQNDRVHPETLMTAAGAIAGWAAQASLFADRAAMDAAARAGDMALSSMTQADGREFLFGEYLNARLFSEDPARGGSCVWNLLAGTAVAQGLHPSRIPNLRAMFSHVTTLLGQPGEGFPSTPAPHQPTASAAALLEKVRPLALTALRGEMPGGSAPGAAVAAQTSYQAITAWATATMLVQCAKVLPVETGLRIGMEAAIYSSKLLVKGQT
jgi:hypothetical protein